MTTAVTIDAHAGWPVKVVTENGEPGYPKTVTTVDVQPNTKHVVYLHSGCRILSITEEVKPPKET